MARKITSKIDNRSARLKLAPRGKAYDFTTIAKGVALGYRRTTAGNGRWVVRGADGAGGNWQKVLPGCADDFADADGREVISFDQAAEAARQMARGDDGAQARRDRPVTNRDALDAYLVELTSGAGDSRNATRVLHHLPEWLGNKPVAMTTKQDYTAFRKELVKTLTPAGAVRTCRGFAAALVQAAEADERITHRAWVTGFAGIRCATVADTANHASDGEIVRLVSACHADDPALGLLVEVAAQTGARPIQIGRLLVASLKADPPRLMMPASNKGKKKEPAPAPLPITADLAARLRMAAAGRKASDPLLVRADGSAWCRMTPNHGVEMHLSYGVAFRRIAKSLGMSDTFGFYGLRHSSIIRQLLKGVPTRVVAAAHDTSVPILEKHYASYIVNFSDDLIRGALIDTQAPAGKVIKLRG